jgi:hypothetical protein
MDGGYTPDPGERLLTVVASTAVGQVFAANVIREFGRGSFIVRRLVAEVAA